MNNTIDPPPLVRPERKATLRLGQRQLSLISLTAISIVVVALLWVGYKGFIDFKITRDVSEADSHMHELYKAMRGYSMDTDEKLPIASKWTEQVAGYLSAPPSLQGGKMAYLRGEDEYGKPIHYVYNDLVSDYKLEDRITPEEQRATLELRNVVLLIEMPGEGENVHIRIPPRNTPQGEEALAKLLTFPHNAGSPDKATTVVLYANGSTERLTRKDLK